MNITNSKVWEVLKKIFPIGFAFTKSVGSLILGIVIHVAIMVVGAILVIIPVIGGILAAAIALYMSASLLLEVVAFSKVLEAPTELVGEDNQVSAILRKIFPVSFKYCNKGKSLAVGIILNVILMLLVSGVMDAISLVLTATIVGILLSSVVSAVAMVINIYFIAAIVVEILLACDVIKAAKPVVPAKPEAEKTEEKEEAKAAE
ncbi:MAG: hypothetical protein IJ011_08865 [Clostridia bacterium]|nr:hypothetical protein [Clostridia bacterium]